MADDPTRPKTPQAARTPSSRRVPEAVSTRALRQKRPTSGERDPRRTEAGGWALAEGAAPEPRVRGTSLQNSQNRNPIGSGPQGRPPAHSCGEGRGARCVCIRSRTLKRTPNGGRNGEDGDGVTYQGEDRAEWGGPVSIAPRSPSSPAENRGRPKGVAYGPALHLFRHR